MKINKSEKLDLYKQEAKMGSFQPFFPFYGAATLMKKYFNNLYGSIWTHVHRGFLTVFLEKDHMKLISEEVFEKVEDGSFYDLWDLWQEFDRELSEASKLIRDLDISKLSGTELWGEYQKILEKHLQMWGASIFIDALDLGLDQKKIETIAKRHNFLPEEVHTLLTPLKPSYVLTVENDLCEVRVGNMIPSDFIEKYFWYGTNYLVHREFDEDDVKELSQDAHKTIIEDISSKQQTILAKYSLEENPFRAFQILAQWRDDRKRSCFFGLYGICRLLAEGMRRHNIDETLIQTLLFSEVEGIFQGKISEETLKERVATHLLINLHEDGSWSHTQGEEAGKRFRELQKFLPDIHVSEISGTPASPGIVKGVARIVPHFASESGRTMNEGDILVTSMTRPEFVPLMRKAAAFVTDEGGISCHAAIVSREMKKPCVIGTKIATQALTDGDIIEVDADNGIVTIIK